jgi:hypothetical protein
LGTLEVVGRDEVVVVTVMRASAKLTTTVPNRPD